MVVGGRAARSSAARKLAWLVFGGIRSGHGIHGAGRTASRLANGRDDPWGDARVLAVLDGLPLRTQPAAAGEPGFSWSHGLVPLGNEPGDADPTRSLDGARSLDGSARRA